MDNWAIVSIIIVTTRVAHPTALRFFVEFFGVSQNLLGVLLSTLDAKLNITISDFGRQDRVIDARGLDSEIK